VIASESTKEPIPDERFIVISIASGQLNLRLTKLYRKDRRAEVGGLAKMEHGVRGKASHATN
jgi:hypothetical protein